MRMCLQHASFTSAVTESGLTAGNVGVLCGRPTFRLRERSLWLVVDDVTPVQRCFFSELCCVKPCLQRSQCSRKFCACTRSCSRTCCRRVNMRPHIAHLYGFAPECAMMWAFSLSGRLNSFVQPAMSNISKHQQQTLTTTSLFNGHFLGKSQ